MKKRDHREEIIHWEGRRGEEWEEKKKGKEGERKKSRERQY